MNKDLLAKIKRNATTGSGQLGGSTSPVDSAKECEVHQDRFLQVYEQQNEDDEKCGKETDDKGHSALLALIFTGKTSLAESHVPKTSGKVWHKKHLQAMEKNQVKETGYTEVHGTWQHASVTAEEAGQCHGQDTQLSLDTHGNQERFLRTGRKQKSVFKKEHTGEYRYSP